VIHDHLSYQLTEEISNCLFSQLLRVRVTFSLFLFSKFDMRLRLVFILDKLSSGWLIEEHFTLSYLFNHIYYVQEMRFLLGKALEDLLHWWLRQLTSEL